MENYKKITSIVDQYEQVLNANRAAVEIAICSILAKGHILIEDLPGVGKTTLVKYLAKTLGLNLNRIQFTNDLLPSDILGTSIFHRDENSLVFHPGPILGELILADELNRAPPKTQSALLQAMEEREISIDNKNFKLDDSFLVIATQNPHGQIGTYELPESQLDRFCCKFKIGNLSKESTIKLFKNIDLEEKLNKVEVLINKNELIKTQSFVQSIHIDESILEYIYELINYSRTIDSLPLSNRCGIDLIKMSKAKAFLNNRDYVIPDDVQNVFTVVTGHRLVSPYNSNIEVEQEISYKILNKVSIKR